MIQGLRECTECGKLQSKSQLNKHLIIEHRFNIARCHNCYRDSAHKIVDGKLMCGICSRQKKRTRELVFGGTHRKIPGLKLCRCGNELIYKNGWVCTKKREEFEKIKAMA